MPNDFNVFIKYYIYKCNIRIIEQYNRKTQNKKWLIDSGASNHMAFISLYSNVQKVTTPHKN
jgi:hypothetical protein